ncbi:hypothetical protein MAR_037025 [Mya arenaria]|uniref:Uncharacterized protein n=1 Tax=Mya arenaria TaxID=6604 RepID=A0ABY7FR30_MYAAR|nr:hypothetical protein MAR_037025 [Mya arenaria]
MQSRLLSAWDAYTAGGISTSGLLKKVSSRDIWTQGAQNRGALGRRLTFNCIAYI